VATVVCVCLHLREERAGQTGRGRKDEKGKWVRGWREERRKGRDGKGGKKGEGCAPPDRSWLRHWS